MTAEEDGKPWRLWLGLAVLAVLVVCTTYLLVTDEQRGLVPHCGGPGQDSCPTQV